MDINSIFAAVLIGLFFGVVIGFSLRLRNPDMRKPGEDKPQSFISKVKFPLAVATFAGLIQGVQTCKGWANRPLTDVATEIWPFVVVAAVVMIASGYYCATMKKG